MAEPTRVFVSYRREDSSQIAGQLADRLDEHFRVSMDVDTVESGRDLNEAIRRAVAEADVFVAVIGPQWTELEDSSGQRRLDDPNDGVAKEVAAALERGMPVIPVLVAGVPMPTAGELPEALGGLASRQAVPLREESFMSDSSRLVGAIERRIPAARLMAETPETQLASWEAQADGAARDRRWSDAVELLERIDAVDPSFGQVARKLPAARRLRRIVELKQEIREQAETGDWQAVLNLGSELSSLDAADDDPGGLVTRARQKLAEERRKQLASLFDQAMQAEAAGRLEEAADIFQQINTLDPQNADVASRLEAVRLRLDSAASDSGADQPAAAMVGDVQRGESSPDRAGTAGGSPTVPPPKGPAPTDAPQPEEEKRSLLPFILVGAALVLVGVFVAALVWFNPGRQSVTGVPSGGTGPSASAEATPTPSTSPASAEMEQLLSYLPADLRETCTEHQVEEAALTPDILATVHCSPAGDGPQNAWYFLYETEAATKRAFAEFVTGTYESGDCTKEQQRMRAVTTEDGREQPSGVLKCYVGVGQEPERTTFAWTHEELHILAFADDPEMTFPEMKRWWRTAGPLRNP